MGGRAYASGNTGGAYAGAVSMGSVSASGFNVTVIAGQTGGAGGGGYSGASGTAGAQASIWLANVVSGITKGGTLSLTETAVGGRGGSANAGGTAGGGRSAGSSSLTLNDLARNTTKAASIRRHH